MVDYTILDFLKVLAVFISLVLLPGYLMTPLALGNQERLDLFELLAWSLAWGTAISAGIGLAIQTFSLSLWATLPLTLAVIATCIILLVVKKRLFLLKPRILISGPILTLIFGIFLIIVFTLLLRRGADLGFAGDQYSHIAVAQAVLNYESPLPPDPHRPDLPLGPNYGFWHYTLAMIARYSGTDLLIAVNPVHALIGVFILLAAYTFANGLLRSEQAAVLSALITLTWYGFVVSSSFENAFFPAVINYGLILLAIMLFSLSIRSRQIRPVILSGLLAVVSLSLHPVEWFALWLAIPAIALLTWSARRNSFPHAWKHLLIWSGLTLALSLPILFDRYGWIIADMANDTLANPIVSTAMGESFNLYKRLADNIFSFLPVGHLLLYIVALVASIYWYFRSKSEPVIVATLAGLMITPLLAYLVGNNLIGNADVLYKMIMRMRLLLPVPAVIGYLLWTTWQNRSHPDRKSWLIIGLSSIALLPLVYTTIRQFVLHEHLISLQDRLASSPLPYRSSFERLDDICPASGIILTDPLTSQAIPVFSRNSVVQNWPHHANAYKGDVDQRVKAIYEIFNDDTQSSEEALSDLYEWGVDCVVHAPTKYYPGYPYSQGLAFYGSKSQTWLDGNPTLFSRHQIRDDFVVYVYHQPGEDTQKMVGKDQDPIKSLPPVLKNPADTTVLPELTMTGFELSAAGPIKAGSDIHLTLGWKINAPFKSQIAAIISAQPEEQDKYPLVLRKIVRNMRERLEKQNLLVKSWQWLPNFNPQGAEWQVGEQFNTNITIQVPVNTLPGKYPLSLTLFPIESALKYSHLSEQPWLEDEDRFTSFPLTSIDIAPP